MKSWMNHVSFEGHIDTIEVSGEKVTITLHAHLDGKPIDNDQTLLVRDLERRRVLVTFGTYEQLKGRDEKKKDIPGQTGGENVL